MHRRRLACTLFALICILALRLGYAPVAVGAAEAVGEPSVISEEAEAPASEEAEASDTENGDAADTEEPAANPDEGRL